MSADGAEPVIMVIYHSLAGAGLAVVAYSDGAVILEANGTSSAAHRRELFSSLSEATDVLGLPLQLTVGEMVLKADSACSPSFEVVRFRSDTSRGGYASGASTVGTAEPVVVTSIRYSFNAVDDPQQGAAGFRTFRIRLGAYERRVARRTRTLAARLGLTEEAFAHAATVEGPTTLEERLEFLGLADRFGDEGDTEWPAEVRATTEAVRLRLGSGPLSAQVLREVLSMRPDGAPTAGPEKVGVDLSGWEAVLEAARNPSGGGFGVLREWLMTKR
eukprot:gnl/TRDRNA2_/TRDRNA2_83879_c0_seq1.p1 gnl/TRDRNA2_/TRDRNA2_83879_c0~~gnl/TRDRNA2_/TRDRNA2_83879_c0_seq1.p1  ORF type:complete len:290 (-),score=44.79 gnl/TRDRNA2_/TRDRNA2_83879_c0_seq1:60-881(-)